VAGRYQNILLISDVCGRGFFKSTSKKIDFTHWFEKMVNDHRFGGRKLNIDNYVEHLVEHALNESTCNHHKIICMLFL